MEEEGILEDLGRTGIKSGNHIREAPYGLFPFELNKRWQDVSYVNWFVELIGFEVLVFLLLGFHVFQFVEIGSSGAENPRSTQGFPVIFSFRL